MKARLEDVLKEKERPAGLPPEVIWSQPIGHSLRLVFLMVPMWYRTADLIYCDVKSVRLLYKFKDGETIRKTWACDVRGGVDTVKGMFDEIDLPKDTEVEYAKQP